MRRSVASTLQRLAGLCGAALIATLPFSAFALDLRGEAVQGGLMFGQTKPGSSVNFDGRTP